MHDKIPEAVTDGIRISVINIKENLQSIAEEKTPAVDIKKKGKKLLIMSVIKLFEKIRRVIANKR